MSIILKRLFIPPEFKNADQNRITWVQYAIHYAFLFGAIIIAIYGILIRGDWLTILILLLASLTVAFGLWMTRLGYYRYSSYQILIMLLCTATYLLYAGQGIHDISIMLYPLAALVASLLLNRREFIITMLLYGLSISAVAYSELNGWIPNACQPENVVTDWLVCIILLGISTVAVRLLADIFTQSLTQAHTNAIALKISNDRLEQQTHDLSARESRLRILTDNMVDTIIQIDESYNLVYVSPSMKRVCGYEADEMTGQPMAKFIHNEDMESVKYKFSKAVMDRTATIRIEFRARHELDHYIWLEAETRLLFDDDCILQGAILGARDITDRKMVEAERQNLYAELKAKNTELEQFTYTVSHDLKAPLITVRGFLSFLEKDALAGNVEAMKADISRISDATTRMQRLLNELLELSRIGRMTYPHKASNFGELVQEAIELVQGSIQEHRVQVTVDKELPIVFGDHARLIEVIQNLLDNAIKFMGDQAEPNIHIGTCGLDQNGMAIFFFEDNGIGIAQEQHERIFGLFNKLDIHSEGTGIGLALVKRIVEVHRGRIWVESKGNNQGSTFYFTLPIEPENNS